LRRGLQRKGRKNIGTQQRYFVEPGPEGGLAAGLGAAGLETGDGRETPMHIST
jgi:hypothetical protein